MSTIDKVLRASALLAVSSGVVAASSIVRYKAVALGGGAESVGVVGVVLGVTTLVTALSGLGIPSSGVRLLAAYRDLSSLAGALEALLRWKWAAVSVATVVTTAAMLGHDALIGQQLGVTVQAATVICAATTVAAAFDGAILNGVQKVRFLAIANATGAMLGTLATVVVALVGSAEQTVAAALAATPLAMAVANAVGRRRAAPDTRPLWSLLRSRGPGEVNSQLVGLGLALLVGTSLAAASQLVVRSAVARSIGLESAGLYQATWAIASLYLGFVLTALGTEYFPRLSRHIEDREVTKNAVEVQTVLSLQLATPCIVVLLVAAEPVLKLLYTEDFTSAALLLRVFLLGDFVKVAAWALVFVFAAKDWRGLVIVTEAVFAVVFTTLSLVLIPVIGLLGVGIAWSTAYVVYLLLAVFIARRLKFEGIATTIATTLVVPVIGAAVMVGLLSWPSLLSMVAAMCIAVALVAASVTRLLSLRRRGVLFEPASESA